MTAYFDARETRSRSDREADQLAALRRQLAHAKANAPYFRKHLRDVDPEAITSLAALATLPITRKSDLHVLQRNSPPLGGLTTVPAGELRRIFQSPGPIYDVQGHGRDYWRIARALFAAGFRSGDRLHVGFSYHLTPAGMMVDSGALALGCAVIPGGTGNTEQQVRAIADLRATAFAGTPSLLSILLDRAAEMGADVSSLRYASVAAEALPTALRDAFAARGVSVRQWYGTADLGLIAYESDAVPGLIVDEGVIVEIVRPGTGDPLADGEVGEVVVTALQSPEYPLIRFATGDLSAVLPGESPCGRTNVRLAGWLGRADQAAKVKGLFVHPAQIAELLRRHPDVVKARLVIAREAGADTMTLRCETAWAAAAGSGANSGEPDVRQRLAETLQSITGLRGDIEFVMIGQLPNDGKVIEDCRNLV